MDRPGAPWNKIPKRQLTPHQLLELAGAVAAGAAAVVLWVLKRRK